MKRIAALLCLLPLSALAACPPESELPDDTVCLEWVAPTENEDGSQLTDLAGFNVYYGLATREYGDAISVPSPDATTTELSADAELQIPAPADGGEVPVFFAMTALDDAGNESMFSNEIVKTIPFPDKLPPGTFQLMRVLIKIAQ